MQKTDKELMLACISQIDSRPDAPNVTQDTEYKVTVDDIKSLFFGKKSKNEQNVYRDIENASKRLYDVDIVMSLPRIKRFKQGLLVVLFMIQITEKSYYHSQQKYRHI